MYTVYASIVIGNRKGVKIGFLILARKREQETDREWKISITGLGYNDIGRRYMERGGGGICNKSATLLAHECYINVALFL